MSHHPSSAELAVFRRSMASPYNSVHGIRYSYGPLMTDTTLPAGNYRGAWSHEKRDGIGARGYLAGASASFDRREASALRSRAYAAKGMASQWLVPVHPRSGGAWYAERVDGAPYQWHTYGRRDGIVASDTWTEDEPRSPLPIRYQPSFVIVR